MSKLLDELTVLTEKIWDQTSDEYAFVVIVVVCLARSIVNQYCLVRGPQNTGSF